MSTAHVEKAAPVVGTGVRAHPVTTLGALGPIVVAFAAALAVLPVEDLGLDGFLSVGLARGAVLDLLEFLRRDVHPPLFYLVLRGWLDLAGTSFATARWIAVASVALTLAFFYALCRRLLGNVGASLGGWMLAIVPSLTLMGATVRDFTPGLAISLGAAYATVRVAQDPSRGWATTAVVAHGLALLTWYFHGVFLLALLAYAVARRRTSLRSVGLMVVVGSALATPWLAYAAPDLWHKLISNATMEGAARQMPRLDALLADIGTMAVGSAPSWLDVAVPPQWVGLGWLAAVAAGLAALAASPSERSSLALTAVGAAAALGVFVFLRGAWMGSDNPARYLLPALPFATLAQAALLRRLLHGGPVAAALAAALLLGFFTLAYGQWQAIRSLPPIPWRQDPVMALLDAEGQPNDVVLFSDLAAYGHYRLRGGTATALTVHFAGMSYLWDDVESRLEGLLPVLQNRPRVWFVDDNPAALGPNFLVNAALSQRLYYAGERAFPGRAVRLYVAGPPTEATSRDVVLGGAVHLISAGYTPRVEAGGVLYVELAWRAIRPLDRSYAVFAHLVGPRDTKMAQLDSWPQAGLRPTTTWAVGELVVDRRALLLPEDAPPGLYHLLIGMYDGDHRLAQPDGQAAVDLGVVTVAR